MTCLVFSSVFKCCAQCVASVCYGVQEVLNDDVLYSVSLDSPSCILVVSPSEHFGSTVCNTLGLAVGNGCEGRPRCEYHKELAVGIGGWVETVWCWFRTVVCVMWRGLV